MRVRMLTIWASSHGCFGPGQVIDLPDALGEQLIKARSAEPVGGAQPRVVTGRPSHRAPSAVSVARLGPAERATADPHNPRGTEPPEDDEPEEEIEDEDGFEDEDELDGEEEGEEGDEAPGAPPVNPMGTVPAEPAAKPDAKTRSNKVPKADRPKARKAKGGK